MQTLGTNTPTLMPDAFFEALNYQGFGLLVGVVFLAGLVLSLIHI